MRVVFWGTPAFAVPSLRSLAAAFDVARVYTGPDAPRGRGLKVRKTEVAQAAEALGLEVRRVEKLKDEALAREVAELRADVGVIVAFRVLPEALFSAPVLGTINAHPSLLPKYRGPSPIRAALLAGETETGVTTFLLKKEVDAGDVLVQRRIEIGDDDDYGALHDKLARVSAEAVVESVKGLADGAIVPRRQDHSLASRAPRMGPEDARIDWTKTTREVVNRVRAFSPEPGASTRIADQTVKILKARAAEGLGRPGEVIACHPRGGLVIATADGAVSIERVKPSGRREMTGADFLRGLPARAQTLIGKTCG